MKNLTDHIKNVYSASTVPAKKLAALELIDYSDAKQSTKDKAKSEIGRAKSGFQIDNYMTNYMLAGEGQGVI